MTFGVFFQCCTINLYYQHTSLYLIKGLTVRNALAAHIISDILSTASITLQLKLHSFL